ncbi:hypothetical protein ACFFT4_31350 [Cohnella cellulosilytica]|uniref:hypothetical protein n=1 Tax=Cohnella cellulosilytica TaxID=986710 RepID=UPI0035E9C191
MRHREIGFANGRQGAARRTAGKLAAMLLAAGLLLPWLLSASAAAETGKGTLMLAQNQGTVRSVVEFEATGLNPNKPAKLIWVTVDGSYELDGIYSFVGQRYMEREEVALAGTTDRVGRWSGSFKVPEGFGGDHTVYVRQDGERLAQNVYFVRPTFKMSPESGPVGTEITIEAEGIGWTTMESNWQLTYDNKFTGLISAVSTNGKATAKIRAAGPAGKHTLTIWHGYRGAAYLNHQQAPTAYLPVPTFEFEVTDGAADLTNAVEPVPAGGGGVVVPELRNKPNVKVAVSRDSGAVGDPVTLTAEGLPTGKPVELVWNTMAGSRVSGTGFAEKQIALGRSATDGEGKLTYPFAIPEDLGGVPHRIDVKVGGVVYGQAYVGIVPSIVGMEPASGPAGTAVEITLQGVGWTEFDNAFYMTYDNAYTGYMCGFNSQGTVKFTVVASGEPGTHLIDLYPGIYQGRQTTPNVYLAPQLTYGEDHPGTRIPAIRMSFNVTEES